MNSTTTPPVPFVGGPLDGAGVVMTPGCGPHPAYLADDGSPIPAQRGGLAGHYVYQWSHGGAVFVHTTVLAAWTRSR